MAPVTRLPIHSVMIDEHYGPAHPHLGYPLDYSTQVGLVTTSTPDAGQPFVEDGRTDPSRPYYYTLATFDSKINREASSIVGCGAPPLNPLTRTFRNIPPNRVRRYSLL